MERWGLRGRWLRRVAAAWIIVLTSTAALLDDTCCCCDCGGLIPGSGAAEFGEIDPLAQERLRSSQVVLAAVGAITSVTVVETWMMPEMDYLYTSETGAPVRKISYVVVGATATITFYVWAVEREGSWVIEAVQSADGAHTDGDVPVTQTSSVPQGTGGGGGGGSSSGGGGGGSWGGSWD